MPHNQEFHNTSNAIAMLRIVVATSAGRQKLKCCVRIYYGLEQGFRDVHCIEASRSENLDA
jgi:hypothetical protein